jgi:hypothetical protein
VIGRSADVNAIAALLHGGARIVTVTGPGGVGKTTVAAATARQLDSEYTGGLRWTSLATVDNPGRVRDAIRQALGVLSPRDAAATASRLGDESWLVVVETWTRSPTPQRGWSTSSPCARACSSWQLAGPLYGCARSRSTDWPPSPFRPRQAVSTWPKF